MWENISWLQSRRMSLCGQKKYNLMDRCWRPQSSQAICTRAAICGKRHNATSTESNKQHTPIHGSLRLSSCPASEVPNPTLLECLQLARLRTALSSKFQFLQRQESDRGGASVRAAAFTHEIKPKPGKLRFHKRSRV